MYTFAVGAAVAGAAGVLMAPLTHLYPDVGFVLFIKGMAAAVLGGLTSIPGAVLGGVLLGLAEQLAAGYLHSSIQDVVAFLVIMFALIFLPTGLLGARGAAEGLTCRCRALVGNRSFLALLFGALLLLPAFANQYHAVRRQPDAALHHSGIGPEHSRRLRRTARLLPMRPSTASAPMERRCCRFTSAGRSGWRRRSVPCWRCSIGTLLAFPALRLSGIFLALATLAFAQATQWVLWHWQSVTFGAGGFTRPATDFRLDTASSRTTASTSSAGLSLWYCSCSLGASCGRASGAPSSPCATARSPRSRSASIS